VKTFYKKKEELSAINQSEVEEVWLEIKTETGFTEKYHFMDWKRFKHFNNSSAFLQLLSLYNMTSPLISLSIPIFFLIFPFILLKIQGIPISLTKYIDIVKMLFKQHQLGQIFALGSASWDKVIYILVSFGFYILQVYQNISSCVKYYYNMKKIHSQLFTMREYAVQTLKNMDTFTSICLTRSTYQPFLATMDSHKTVLEKMVSEFIDIKPNGFTFQKFRQIGHVMKCFYQLYNKSDYHDALAYSFGFNGYLDNLLGLGKRVSLKQVNACKIIDDSKPTTFSKAYFPTLVANKPIKNSYTLDKHVIITGPNAAGKTTLLKTTIFNIILSQQTGFGFYKKAAIKLYDYIHCYINIPDTSARDSLFQAEARRCKDILELIQNNSQEKQHLCVFDELYSGTNPYEAIASAHAFLSYLNTCPNINFLLTTHFLDLCKRLDKQTSIKNVHMEVQEQGEDFNYTYKMKKDISTVKGGVKVLRDLEYPLEIINNTIATLKEIVI
jgi:energy-coupling factor transporter ATP-binding protein EcfA2